MTVRAISRTRTAFATVRILITRITNQMPFFLNEPYQISIFSSRLVNDTILSVTARDNDLVVCNMLLFNGGHEKLPDDKQGWDFVHCILLKMMN